MACYIFIYAIWSYAEFAIVDGSTRVILLMVMFSMSGLKAIIDCVLYCYSFKIVNLFIRQLWPSPSVLQLMIRWLGYILATLLFFLGKIMKEFVYHGISEVFAEMGLDLQKTQDVVNVMEDVEANSQIFSAYGFGFFVLAIYDHFGSI